MASVCTEYRTKFSHHIPSCATGVQLELFTCWYMAWALEPIQTVKESLFCLVFLTNSSRLHSAPLCTATFHFTHLVWIEVFEVEENSENINTFRVIWGKGAILLPRKPLPRKIVKYVYFVYVYWGRTAHQYNTRKQQKFIIVCGVYFFAGE